jgi:hypothetical protein
MLKQGLRFKEDREESKLTRDLTSKLRHMILDISSLLQQRTHIEQIFSAHDAI